MNVMIDSERLFEAFEYVISEGIINYWGYTVVRPGEAIRLIKEGKSFDVFDVEDNEKLATVTIETIEKGFEVLINEYPHIFANLMTYTADYLDMEIFFQLCCFGMVVYG